MKGIKLNIRFTLLIVMFGALIGGCSSAPAGDTYKYLPSPDWSKQSIYFIMTDRFFNGDTANDVQTADGIESGAVGHLWNGGDLQGLIDKLQYIKGMGFTAIWITPPVLNQWLDNAIPYSGFHGYWASSFVKVDPHYGTLEKYQEF